MLALLLILAATPAVDGFYQPEASDTGRTAPTGGLFPLWENTGVILGHGQVSLGTGQLGVGLGDRIQVSTSPLRLVFRTPNLGVKVALFSTPQWRLAASLDALWLMPGASDMFSTSNISTRLDAGRQGQLLFPLAVSGSFAPGGKVTLHFTVTGLTTYATRADAWLGVSAVAEWRPLLHHAFAVHLTEVGLWRHDFLQFGGSYRYQRGIFEGRLGVGYQLRPDGSLVVPSASLGVEL